MDKDKIVTMWGTPIEEISKEELLKFLEPTIKENSRLVKENYELRLRNFYLSRKAERRRFLGIF